MPVHCDKVRRRDKLDVQCVRRPSPREVLRRVPQHVAVDMQVSGHRPSGELPGREAPTNVGPCKS